MLTFFYHIWSVGQRYNLKLLVKYTCKVKTYIYLQLRSLSRLLSPYRFHSNLTDILRVIKTLSNINRRQLHTRRFTVPKKCLLFLSHILLSCDAEWRAIYGVINQNQGGRGGDDNNAGNVPKSKNTNLQRFKSTTAWAIIADIKTNTLSLSFLSSSVPHLV